jgi:hypothetical protein
MYAVENYGKDSLSHVTICYMMNSMAGNLNSYLSPYCEEEANYLQYSVIFNVLIPFKKRGNHFLSNIPRFKKEDFCFEDTKMSPICSRRRNTMKTEISM